MDSVCVCVCVCVKCIASSLTQVDCISNLKREADILEFQDPGGYSQVP